MSKTGKELFEEKMGMVYEYNHASSLFVRAANIEISNNHLHNALNILNEGLKKFPNYPTAHILLGKVHILLGNFDLAENAFHKGCDLINSNDTLNYYLSELENFRSQRSHFTESRRVAFFQDDLKEMITNSGTDSTNGPADETKPGDENTPGTVEADTEAKELEDRLEDLAKEITSVKFTLDNNDKDLPLSEPKSESAQQPQIVSETLAKIYISQGKFKEAMEVYKKLQIKSPEKRSVYQAKIDEIMLQLGDSDW